jgi:hypothetical protein
LRQRKALAAGRPRRFCRETATGFNILRDTLIQSRNDWIKPYPTITSWDDKTKVDARFCGHDDLEQNRDEIKIKPRFREVTILLAMKSLKKFFRINTSLLEHPTKRTNFYFAMIRHNATRHTTSHDDVAASLTKHDEAKLLEGTNGFCAGDVR